MSIMLATIDDITAAQVDRDRRVHGEAYLRVLPCGKVEHVPIECVGPQTRAALVARCKARAAE